MRRPFATSFNDANGMSDQQNQQLTQSFCDVVDVAGGGMVGGLGDRFTRVAAAHAVHNGLTVLPQTEKFLPRRQSRLRSGAKRLAGSG